MLGKKKELPDAPLFTNETARDFVEPNLKQASKKTSNSPELLVVNYQKNGSVKIGDAPPAPSGDSEKTVVRAVENGMTLDALQQLAIENNPAIRQASAVVNRAMGIRSQVGLLPNPTVGYFGQEIGNEGAAGQHGVFISQTFVSGQKLDWNNQVIGHDVESLRWLVEAQRFRVRTDIQIRFYTVLAAQRRLEMSQQFRTLAEKGLEIAKDRLKAAIGTRPDILQTEIQLSQIDLEIQKTKLELESSWNEIASIAGTPEMARPVLIGDLNIDADTRDVETIYSEILSKSPVLQSALERVNRARANLQRQRAQNNPNLTAQLGVGHDDATGDEYANIQFSIPLRVNNRNEGNIRAAYSQYCEATQDVERMKMKIRSDLAGVIRKYKTAQAVVQQYEESILPKAKETLKLTQEKDLAVRFDFLRELTVRRTYFAVNLEYVNALGDLARANAEIEGALLTGGLSNTPNYETNAGLRSQAFSGQ